MPYISQERRYDLLARPHSIENAGELNYMLTMVINDYLGTSETLTYMKINDIMGALEGAKLEFYRRIAVPYENTKIATNGDVYS
jgi:hypothetical protein